jgi:nucleoside-diphosphate-sugar epimerase
LINIIISGASGFLGSNWITYSEKYVNLNNMPFKRDEKISKYDLIGSKKSVFLHLAGRAHDTKKTLNPEVYFDVNTVYTKKLFDEFLLSKIDTFIIISSVKSVCNHTTDELTELSIPQPISDYGKSKYLAEQYILSKKIPPNKKIYILRPCMIHGPNNKGNLNLLYNEVKNGLPWPLGLYKNKRSFCSIENICFVINELINRNDIPSGIYNIADDVALSTNDLIKLIATSQNKKPLILNIPKSIIFILSRLGDFIPFPLNSERLEKLTESFLVSNRKIIKALGKSLPISSKEGLLKTFQSFIKIY